MFLHPVAKYKAVLYFKAVRITRLLAKPAANSNTKYSKKTHLGEPEPKPRCVSLSGLSGLKGSSNNRTHIPGASWDSMFGHSTFFFDILTRLPHTFYFTLL